MPSRCWTFFEFLSSGGRRVIQEWIRDVAPRNREDELRAELDAMIRIMEVTQTFSDYDWKQRRENRDIYEIRLFFERVQYRPLAFKGPASGEITLLMGAIEKSGRLQTKSAVETAAKRMNKCNQDRRRIAPYEFGPR